MATLIVKLIVALALGVLALYLFVALLWRRKMEEDRRDYTEVLGESKVKTYYRPEEFARACEEAWAEEADERDRRGR